ncbi:MAG TPA: iron-containing alcohol dehydrogenase [Prolixibacteraceae bacterium]|mgnify:CR=1 FL=1|nr:iron-containing alcohol dehydrogenase [Prolixibacteraceae bacterium]
MKNGHSAIELAIRKFVAPEFIFGIDARLMVGQYCQKLGGKKILLVTDEVLSGTKWIAEIKRILDSIGIEYLTYSDILPNPRDFQVMNGAQIFLQNQCNLILAVGGGSVMDCAKGIGIVSTNHKDIGNFEGVDQIERPIPPLICIPTTGGTAADVSQFAIINNIGEKYKMAIISKAIVPDVALIDPVVLTTMDNYLTAYTGMDALSHAFEAYVSNASSSFTDLYALEAIRLIQANLIQTIAEPNDIQLRGKIMLASLYAGLAFSNASLGCVHSLAHSLGGYLDLAHGECNAILLPHVVDFNFHAASEKYSIISQIFDIDTARLSSSDVKKGLMVKLMDFNKQLGIIATLQQKGVRADIVPILANKAIKDPCNATNPHPPVKRDLEIIYSSAM